MNVGKLKEALPYYETIMDKVNFQVDFLYFKFMNSLEEYIWLIAILDSLKYLYPPCVMCNNQFSSFPSTANS